MLGKHSLSKRRSGSPMVNGTRNVPWGYPIDIQWIFHMKLATVVMYCPNDFNNDEITVAIDSIFIGTIHQWISSNLLANEFHQIWFINDEFEFHEITGISNGFSTFPLSYGSYAIWIYHPSDFMYCHPKICWLNHPKVGCMNHHESMTPFALR